MVLNHLIAPEDLEGLTVSLLLFLSLWSSVCSGPALSSWCLVGRVYFNMFARPVLLYPSRGHRSDLQRDAKTAAAQSRCVSSAALSDRANEAVCNGILCSFGPQNGYQWPKKLNAAGLRPAHQCTILHPLRVFRAA